MIFIIPIACSFESIDRLIKCVWSLAVFSNCNLSPGLYFLTIIFIITAIFQSPISMADLRSPPAFSAAAASSASASASSSYPRYDAFISHRGPDCKHGLATRLYRRLCDLGLLIFLDCEELIEGRNITSQLESAIRGASVQVAILSPGYAESYWCLNELVLMVSSEKTILPVFYNVDPSMVRRATGNYGKALQNLQEKTTLDPQTGEVKPRYDSNTVQSWRDALSHVGNLSGFVLHGDEGELMKLEEVVQSVFKNVPRAPFHVAHPTGLGEILQNFERKVLLKQQGSKATGAKIVGIVGVGGVGKTTLAKHLFNLNLKRLDYKASSFLSDVRENARIRSLNNLQSKLLVDLIPDLKHKDIKIESPDQGVGILKRHLQSCHALIILDDVDDIDQMEAFLPIRDILSSESLILVTSRDWHVLRSSGLLDSSIYNLRGLNMSDSKELFCSYAFCQRHPLPEFEDLVNRFVMACDGLPLSLKIFGALVCRRNKSYWEGSLEQLHRLPPKIQERLRISYESLEEPDQEIFLDIVCFFIGEEIDTAIRIWGVVGVENLESKCLLEVDTEKRIKMHDHIRDMGRTIAEAVPMPRRLFQADDFLKPTSSGITEVRGISMVPRMRKPDFFPYISSKWKLFNKDRYDCMNLKFLATEGDYLEAILREIPSQPLIWLRWYHYLKAIWRRVPSTPLIWLRWYHCPYSSLPSWVPMERLRVLEVKGSRLEMLWQLESQPPLLLRELHIDSPSFSEFPKSIGQLEYLEKVVVYRGWYPLPLKRLPEEFCHLHRLKCLILHGCSEMMSLPDSFGSLTDLQHLRLLAVCSLKTLPDSVGNLTSLQHFELSDASRLEKLPNSFGKLTSLQRLSLPGAVSLKTLPNSFGCLTSLQHLYLSCASSLKTLLDCLGKLTNLKRLKLDLEDSCMFGLKQLVLGQVSISELAFHEGVCSNLQYLTLWACKELRQIGELYGTAKLRALVIMECTNLEELPSLETLICLRALVVFDCPKLKSIQGLGQLTKLRRIKIDRCPELRQLPGVKYSSRSGRDDGFLVRFLCSSAITGPEIEAYYDSLAEVSDELLDFSVEDCPKLQMNDAVVEEQRPDGRRQKRKRMSKVSEMEGEYYSPCHTRQQKRRGN